MLENADGKPGSISIARRYSSCASEKRAEIAAQLPEQPQRPPRCAEPERSALAQIACASTTRRCWRSAAARPRCAATWAGSTSSALLKARRRILEPGRARAARCRSRSGCGHAAGRFRSGAAMQRLRAALASPSCAPSRPQIIECLGVPRLERERLLVIRDGLLAASESSARQSPKIVMCIGRAGIELEHAAVAFQLPPRRRPT